MASNDADTLTDQLQVVNMTLVGGSLKAVIRLPDGRFFEIYGQDAFGDIPTDDVIEANGSPECKQAIAARIRHLLANENPFSIPPKCEISLLNMFAEYPRIIYSEELNRVLRLMVRDDDPRRTFEWHEAFHAAWNSVKKLVAHNS